jgi:hypothetical protein
MAPNLSKTFNSIQVEFKLQLLPSSHFGKTSLHSCASEAVKLSDDPFLEFCFSARATVARDTHLF